MTTAWLAGASGLVGGELLGLLLADRGYAQVVSVGRRTLPIEDPKLLQVKVDFADRAAFEALPPPAVALSCLGTTIKKAGSRVAFRAVDHDAVLTFAKAALAKGARTFVHVSSLGADAESRQLYMAVKGEVETALSKLGFDSVYALRPSILDGAREENRPLERVMLGLARTLGGVLGKYRPTSSIAVARTMMVSAKAPARGAHVLEAASIRANFSAS